MHISHRGMLWWKRNSRQSGSNSKKNYTPKEIRNQGINIPTFAGEKTQKIEYYSTMV